MNINTDLLVLYACETGIGKIIEGEGVMTLTRGFIYSGATNIVQSLWSISDASTKDLAIYFFKEILNGKDYPLALQNAKLKMINYGIVPYHWSGLVIIGE